MQDFSKSIFVVGPGHTLNELTSRLLNIIISSAPPRQLWEMYAGPLGLYARHSDDYGLENNYELLMYYNDFIRNPGPEDNFKVKGEYFDNFKQLLSGTDISLFINTFDLEHIVEQFPHSTFFTTVLDLPNSKNIHHHLMMEFATGAGIPGQEYPDISIERMCARLVKKSKSEKKFLNTIPDNFKIVNVNDLFDYNFSVFDDFTDSLTLKNISLEIDMYKFYNQCSHPNLIKISNMSWEQIVSIANKFTNEHV